VKEWEQIGEIKETHTLKVSARGDGLCLYLPKNLCEVHGIIAGDRLKVHIRDHYRLRIPEAQMGVLHSSAELCKGEKKR
jgi:hypothetical protein